MIAYIPELDIYGGVVKQQAYAFEVRFSSRPTGSKYRHNHTAMVLCGGIQQAIELVLEQWKDDVIINQVVLRNNAMSVLIGEL